jgi:hypothetical protein
MSAGQKFRRMEWDVVKVNFAHDLYPGQGQSEMEDAIVAKLRRTFREGPAAAAEAQTAFNSWIHNVVKLDRNETMSPTARRWDEFVDWLWEHRESIAAIDGVDFSQVPKETPEQKPKQRMRMRM